MGASLLAAAVALAAISGAAAQAAQTVNTYKPDTGITFMYNASKTANMTFDLPLSSPVFSRLVWPIPPACEDCMPRL